MLTLLQQIIESKNFSIAKIENQQIRQKIVGIIIEIISENILNE